MASMVAKAKIVPTDDMEILELELPRASAKSKEINDTSKTMKIGAHLEPK